ncbi:hypothetical protein AYI68_g5798 [Smittium mucronatum]|uniref:Uncharacterized protein n=1 Tax=Smittium mucronatum TaxID=133383 RepID=A0A1R0GT96_9FUNG|nr:hypothetical protein AYI68_g5798 [Smittium mucronatum]
MIYKLVSFNEKGSNIIDTPKKDDRASDTSVSISSEVPALGHDLESSVKFSVGPVMEDLVSSLLGLLLGSGPNPPVRLSPIILTVRAVKTLSVVSK